ncbi:MAG TPA: aminomethyl-transferring glycine dehydrogenase subunit GcvPA, partial [Acidiferrobacteraceae bacterium]|nr:aminomethyl-transferring glycine dehydrogenase subunit GcvPA [Acidiferrobacteraceae bacterium]
FSEIPPALRYRGALGEVPDGLSEMEITRLMQERADLDGRFINFIGAGAYEHHIPAAVWQIATRGEFYTSYTPYQAEASQGTLQLLYEFQTMIAELTGLEVANASLYDGASALAEAVLMAVRLARGSSRVLLPATLNPRYREVVQAIVSAQGIEIVDTPMDAATGTIDLEAFAKAASGCAAVVIPQPNFFGMIEDVDALVGAARTAGALVIGVVNPVACALLAPPGEWGNGGADIAVGDGQPLGVPLSSGGPYLGFMACKKAHVRQMPGRIIGRTLDLDGRPGYVLTLQAREQHIRRSKATSNICTNQGLLVTVATIHMALLGAEGLQRVARACHANTVRTVQALTALPGVEQAFSGSYFHECVLRLKVPAAEVLRALEAQGIIGGLSLTTDFPELGEAILVCATETRTAADIRSYAEHMERIVSRRRLDPPCAVRGT